VTVIRREVWELGTRIHSAWTFTTKGHQSTRAGPFRSVTIEDFQRLPITAHNEKLLELRAHPQARVITEQP
jgi:hypothetical protein